MRIGGAARRKGLSRPAFSLPVSIAAPTGNTAEYAFYSLLFGIPEVFPVLSYWSRFIRSGRGDSVGPRLAEGAEEIAAGDDSRGRSGVTDRVIAATPYLHGREGENAVNLAGAESRTARQGYRDKGMANPSICPRLYGGGRGSYSQGHVGILHQALPAEVPERLLPRRGRSIPSLR